MRQSAVVSGNFGSRPPVVSPPAAFFVRRVAAPSWIPVFWGVGCSGKVLRAYSNTPPPLMGSPACQPSNTPPPPHPSQFRDFHPLPATSKETKKQERFSKKKERTDVGVGWLVRPPRGKKSLPFFS